MSNTTLLMPTFTNCKSFYGKARVTTTDTKIVLTSYTTDVAEFDLVTNELKIKGEYSSTTMRHIREFMKQFCRHIPTDLKTIRKIINNEFVVH